MPRPSSFSVRGPAGSSWAIAPPRPAPLHAVEEPPADTPPPAVPLAGLLLTSAAPGSPEAGLAAQARLAVRDALTDVPAADRLLVELRVFHGWSTDEIAQLAAGAPDEVSARLEAVLDRLGLDHAAVLPVPVAEPDAAVVPPDPLGEEEVVA